MKWSLRNLASVISEAILLFDFEQELGYMYTIRIFGDGATKKYVPK